MTAPLDKFGNIHQLDWFRKVNFPGIDCGQPVAFDKKV